MMPKLNPKTQKPEIPEKFNFLWQPAPIKVCYGGRGKGASWSIARVLIYKALIYNRLILCTREIQNSIKDSVHRLLCNQIIAMGLGEYFEISLTSIKCKVSGSEFIFKGLREYNIAAMKSLEGVDDVWLAEAQSLSKISWGILEPTIRKDGSEIFIDYNPDEERDFIHQHFVVNTPPPGSIVRRFTYLDNPYFPQRLEEQRLFALSRTVDMGVSEEARNQALLDYDNVWLGEPKKISMAAIFRSRVKVHEFETPAGIQMYFGADFGFSEDPSVLLRMFITRNADKSEELWIDYEVCEQHVEINDMPAFYAGGMSEDRTRSYTGIPGAKQWPIKADSARPETISYLQKKGFIIAAAKKWSGSVEDGITHLKAFRLIHIHPRCKNIVEEARLYCYKVDKAGNILPLVVDAHNHGWDSARYGLDDFISARGGVGVWERLI